MTERLHVHFSLACIGKGNGNLLQCSCLENPRDWGAWWAAIYAVAQSRTLLKWLSSSSNHITKLLRFQTSRVLTTEFFFFFFFFNFLVAQLVKNPPAVQETQVLFLGLEDLLEKGKATHSSILGLPCFPGGSAGKESAWNVGDLGLIPGFGRSPGEGNGYSLQYSGLENSMDYSPGDLKESDMTEWLSLSFYF